MMAIVHWPMTCRLRVSALAAGVAVFLSLTGCGTGTVQDATVTPPPTTPSTPTAPTAPTTPSTPTTPPPTTPPLLVSGKVLAGTQPITGASVQVYAAGSSGNGLGATALLDTPAVTDTKGAFAISAGLNCPSSSSMLYLIARGGQVSSGSANSGIALATAIGACGQLSTTTTTQFTVNEVTTVAMVWTLNQFMANGGSIGATATNAKGLSNAFATAANLADPATGNTPGTGFSSTGTSPAPKINALANLLNTCVGSAGTPAAASPCDALFNAVTVTGGATPSNTLDAALRLARNPGNNVASIYTQAASSAVFAPALANAPSDWTLSLNLKGGGLNGPTGVGIDSQGNVWVASYYGVASQFTPTGSPVFASGVTGYGLHSSYGLAIDPQNNVWIPNGDSPSTVNKGLGTVTVLNSSGQPVSGANGFSAGGLNSPIAIAIDTNGTAWIVDYGNARVTLLSNSGNPLSGTVGYSVSSLAFPTSVAIDANHNAWIGNQNDGVVTRISADGLQSNGLACCNGPQALAVDQRGYVWAANYYGDSVSLVSPTGTVVSSGYTMAGLVHPLGVAIDGSGSVWTVSARNASGTTSNPTLTQIAGSDSSSPGHALSPSGGWLADAGMLIPFGIAIDASGNIWITNFGNNTITEVVGMAVPVRTPLNGSPQTP